MASTHIVQQGECLSSIAKKYGYRDWRTIYRAPENAALRRKRPNPNILHPGDEIVIPDLTPRHESAATTQRHKYVLHNFETTIHIVIQDEMGRPLKNKRYKLRVGEQVYHGKTSGTGAIEKKIDADTSMGELTVYALGGGYCWSLDIGHLDPHDEESGVKGRLHNLGFDADLESKGLDETSIEGLKAFQYAAGLDVTGKIDDDTRKTLRDWHDTAQEDG